ncbi:MAG: hypothetical protein WAN76_23235, partial [Candidatus Sulfotelmatobacter sp.]
RHDRGDCAVREGRSQKEECRSKNKLILHSEFFLLHLKKRGLRLAASSFLPEMPGGVREMKQ